MMNTMIEMPVQVALLEGTRNPQDQSERDWLEFMGGVRGPTETWPQKWIICSQCESEWLCMAFPSPTGRWVFNHLCKACRLKEQERAARATRRARKDLDD